jgi:hypothetical protein
MPAPGPLGWLFGEDTATKFGFRYRQLLASVPHGAFYASDGQVLPFKGDIPHDLQVVVGTPLTKFNVYVNDVYTTLATSGSDGVVNLTIKLVNGRNDIKLVNANE